MDCVACNLPDCSCFLSTATTCQTCVRGARIWLSAAAAHFTQTAFRLVRQLFFFMDETGRYKLVFITDSCFDLVLHNQPQFNYGEHQESSLARILASTYFSVCPTQLWWPDWVSSKIRVPSSSSLQTIKNQHILWRSMSFIADVLKHTRHVGW